MIDVNIPLKSMKAIVVFFKKRDSTDSEEYLNANIENVKVSVEGVPNSLFSQGRVKSNIYDEAKRLFGSKNEKNNIDKINFLKNKYALVIDFRCVDQEDVVNSGRRLVGSQAGVLLEVTKKVTYDRVFGRPHLCNRRRKYKNSR